MTTAAAAQPPASAPRGTLLLIGGGLDDDNRPVYERLLALATRNGPADIVIATAASGDQDQEATDKSEALRTWRPGVRIEFVRRETPPAETVAAFERATAVLFTGGDQQRITARYRPDNQPSPEWLALQRLLQRGGVIAGASAGDAMMGAQMFYGGASSTALGLPAPPDDDDPPAKAADPGQADPGIGPGVGPGMGFLPWAMTDSHFFERNRIGRLVAALETGGVRLGIGVGEDACVEVDLASRELVGVSVSEALVIDASGLQRQGITRSGLMARVLHQGERLRVSGWLARLAATPPSPARPAGAARAMSVVDAGQNRQLASWRLFRQASDAATGAVRLDDSGYAITAMPAGAGNVRFEVGASAAGTPH